MESNYVEEIMAKISCYIKDGNSKRNKPNYNEVWELIQDWYEGKIKQLKDEIRGAFECVEDCPELDMSNYNHNQVDELNKAMIEVYQMLQKALEGKDV